MLRSVVVFFFFSFSGWGESESTWYVGHCWPIVPARMIDDDYGAVGWMRIGRGNRSTRRKPAPVQLCPSQIPHDLTWDRTRAGTMGSQRLTAWAMARPRSLVSGYQDFRVTYCPDSHGKESTWRWNQQVILKRCSTRLHDIPPQKTVILIIMT
jgi:hypothetical protein